MDAWEAFDGACAEHVRFYLAHLDTLQSYLPDMKAPDDATRCYGTGAMLLLVALVVGVYRPRLVHDMLALPATLLCLCFAHAFEMPAQYEVLLAPLLGAFLAEHPRVSFYGLMLHADVVTTLYLLPAWTTPAKIATAVAKALVFVAEMLASAVITAGLAMMSVHFGCVGTVPTPLAQAVGCGVFGLVLRRQHQAGRLKLSY
ncbi:hypothetical protein SPRG_15309 [Saprolegnia parasitica CBS 223.65]|uniref:Uncharacterized protein n=1 Tax=Saprolegnia parasitica (strain CBS 223.65) TaxID=695850 RepID=A0A067BMQ2_SAPPC|nr:hypothetical protein SPRG_15309 [Saprolegnia parasitica CBS 223.65]KDO19503.1 hypothetical protein SPRG_15309 [Saprolegnia parasitica CBS 223.65]|eukprot:XP_012209806.1 hypothetical protein SPRG_15309 [Saprolegnia parasitica CBS 223.65]